MKVCIQNLWKVPAFCIAIELLNKYEAMIEKTKDEADTIRNSIKAKMEGRETEVVREKLLRLVNVSKLSRVCDISRTTAYKYIGLFRKIKRNREPRSAPCLSNTFILPHHIDVQPFVVIMLERNILNFFSSP